METRCGTCGDVLWKGNETAADFKTVLEANVKADHNPRLSVLHHMNMLVIVKAHQTGRRINVREVFKACYAEVGIRSTLPQSLVYNQ